MTLQDLRIQNSLTQQEVAKQTGISYGTYRRYEYGEEFPKKDAVKALARLYGMSPGSLFNILIGENNDTLITDNNYEEGTVMPILPMIDLPRPESPREFEYILREYCAETYGGHAQLYNNQGKEHFGVNIMINRPDGTRVYVLCRNYRNTKITVSDIDERVLEIDNAKFNMSEAVLVTSIFKPDPELQEHVYQISDERISKGLCPINIIFSHLFYFFLFYYF